MPEEEKYWKEIEGLAREVKEEFPNPDDPERSDYITENVDAHRYITYTKFHQFVLDHTDNEPDPRDVKGMSLPDADWKVQRQTAAFLSMEADVWQELRKLDEEEPKSAKEWRPRE